MEDTEDPLELEQFQLDFVQDVFTGTKECWLIVPEENGKTTLIAALSLYHIQHRPGGKVPVGASSRDQAELLFQQADGFITRWTDAARASARKPAMAADFKPLEGYRRIRCDRTRGRIQIFAADDGTGDGVIPTMCVAEELHRHRNLKLYRTWTGKLRKRKGQVVVISTAGEPGTEFEQTRLRIREGSPVVERRSCFVRAASPTVVLHDYHVPDKADVEDMRVVKNANPASWINVDTLREKRHSLTMTLAHWKRFTCNQATRDEAAAIAEAEWSALAVDMRIPRGAPIWLGLDIGWKWDTSAAVPLWIAEDRRRLLGPAAVLVPPRDGTSLKPDAVKKALLDIHKRNPIHTVVMDMTRAEELAQWIQDELGATVIDHSQSNAQAAVDYERFMEAMRTGGLAHSGDANLTQHVLNAVARELQDGKTRFERPRATRQAAGQERRVIDALTAAAMVNSEVTGLEKQPPKQRWRVLAS